MSPGQMRAKAIAVMTDSVVAAGLKYDSMTEAFWRDGKKFDLRLSLEKSLDRLPPEAMMSVDEAQAGIVMALLGRRASP